MQPARRQLRHGSADAYVAPRFCAPSREPGVAVLSAGSKPIAGDVLYLHVSPPQPGEGEETPERHVLRLAPGSHRIVGLTVINARHVVNRDGRLVVTVPEAVEASADEPAPALQSACHQAIPLLAPALSASLSGCSERLELPAEQASCLRPGSRAGE
jgi:hypothetical protein